MSFIIYFVNLFFWSATVTANLLLWNVYAIYKLPYARLNGYNILLTAYQIYNPFPTTHKNYI